MYGLLYALRLEEHVPFLSIWDQPGGVITGCSGQFYSFFPSFLGIASAGHLHLLQVIGIVNQLRGISILIRLV